MWRINGYSYERRATKKPLIFANQGLLFGAGEMNRTPDLLITNELLYRLSYTGEGVIIPTDGS